jgi:hypothetical protein
MKNSRVLSLKLCYNINIIVNNIIFFMDEVNIDKIPIKSCINDELIKNKSVKAYHLNYDLFWKLIINKTKGLNYFLTSELFQNILFNKFKNKKIITIHEYLILYE